MLRRVLVVWSASRVAVLTLGALLTAQLGWHRALQPWQTVPFRALTGWDSVYYVRISHTGYHPGRDVAFFPLYPAAIWLTREVTRVGDAVAALAVSNAAVLAGLVGLYVLARDRLSEEHARRSVLYLVLSPYAFALTMAYSEGLFLALATWLFVLSDRERDLAAAPLAFAAGLTRITGLALVAPLALRAWRRRTWSAWLTAVAPVAAFAAHAAWLDHTVGDPLAMVHVQTRWGGHPSVPPVSLVDQFLRFSDTHNVFFLVIGVTVVAYLALIVPLVRSPRFAATRAEDLLLVACIFAMPLLSSVVQSVGRFGLVAFPLVFAMADLGLRSQRVHRAYVVYAPTAQIILFAAAALGYRPP
jgi:Mannosyltransferase (PIG-V)